MEENNMAVNETAKANVEVANKKSAKGTMVKTMKVKNELTGKDLIKTVFSVFDENRELLHTSLGRSEQSIYKEELFKGLTDREKKAYRKKIRNMSYDAFVSIINEKDKGRLQKLVDMFVKFYKQTYKVNDFTFASVASENTRSEKKEVITKALEIVRKTIKK